MSIRHTHAALLEALASELPHRILGQAEAADLEEGREHARIIAKLLGDYLFDYGMYLKENMTVIAGFDPHGFRDGLSDLFQDTIGGPLLRAEEAVRDEELEAV